MAYGVAAGGLYAETAAEAAATEASLGSAVYGTGAAAAGASLFSTLMPVIGIGYLAYGIFSSSRAAYKQRKQQVALAEQQIKQAELLREKVKRDNAEVFSAARSATSIQSGAMGAIY